MNIVNLHSIDKQLSRNVDCIYDIADKLTFTENFQFTIGQLPDQLPIGSLNFQGIYFFEIQNSLEPQHVVAFLQDFKSKWERPDYKPRFVPNTTIKRLSCHTSPMEWVPLYIGKSKNISARVNEHLNMPLTRNTFGMKIFSRDNLTGHTFRVSTIALNVQNYDLIAPAIEKFLRDKFNPILGRQ
jgi:hypothetical protein